MTIDVSEVSAEQSSRVNKVLATIDYPFSFDIKIVSDPNLGTGAKCANLETPVRVMLGPDAPIGHHLPHELGHGVDAKVLTPELRRIIGRLLHGWNHCSHAWEPYSGTFDSWELQPDEGFCELFLLAFSTQSPYPMAESHRPTNAKARALRTLLSTLPIPDRLNSGTVTYA